MECSGNRGRAESGARAVAGTPGSGERSGIVKITGGDGRGEADAHDPQRADAAERRTPAAGHDARCSDGRPVDLQLAGALRIADPTTGLVSPTVWRVHRRRHDRCAAALTTEDLGPGQFNVDSRRLWSLYQLIMYSAVRMKLDGLDVVPWYSPSNRNSFVSMPRIFRAV